MGIDIHESRAAWIRQCEIPTAKLIKSKGITNLCSTRTRASKSRLTKGGRGREEDGSGRCLVAHPEPLERRVTRRAGAHWSHTGLLQRRVTRPVTKTCDDPPKRRVTLALLKATTVCGCLTPVYSASLLLYVFTCTGIFVDALLSI